MKDYTSKITIMPPSQRVMEAQSHLSMVAKGLASYDEALAKLALRYDWYVSNVQFLWREFGNTWRDIEIPARRKFVAFIQWECQHFEDYLEQDTQEQDVQFGVV